MVVRYRVPAGVYEIGGVAVTPGSWAPREVAERSGLAPTFFLEGGGGRIGAVLSEEIATGTITRTPLAEIRHERFMLGTDDEGEEIWRMATIVVPLGQSAREIAAAFAREIESWGDEYIEEARAGR